MYDGTKERLFSTAVCVKSTAWCLVSFLQRQIVRDGSWPRRLRRLRCSLDLARNDKKGGDLRWNRRRYGSTTQLQGGLDHVDRDPLVTGARIGNCLHNSHVTQPIFKSRIRSLMTAPFHGIEEIILDRPFLGEFLRHIHFMQGAVAHPTGLDHVSREIVD